eukprot:46126_1
MSQQQSLDRHLVQGHDMRRGNTANNVDYIDCEKTGFTRCKEIFKTTRDIVERYVDYDFANKDGEIKIDSDYKRRLLRKKQKQKLINGMHALSAQKRKQDASENERKEDQSGNEDNDVEMSNANNTNRRSRLRNMFGA